MSDVVRRGPGGPPRPGVREGCRRAKGGQMSIRSIAGIVRTHGRERPDALAIHYDGTDITFGELDARSNRLANALAATGIGDGDRVAFLDKNGPEYFETTFALSKLNAVNVAVNWRLAPTEIAQVINDSTAKALVVGQDFVPHIEKVEADIPTVSTIVAIGGHARWEDYEAFVAGHVATDPGTEGSGSDVAFQLYTSGTTGLPKGVMLTNDNFFKGVMNVTESWRFTPDSVNIAVMPMVHIGRSGWAMVGLYHGCQTVLLRDVDPGRILQLISEFRVTNAFIVPAVIRFMLQIPGVTDADFSSLHAIVYGASPITDAVLTKAMEV